MRASREFAQYVIENGVNTGNELCGVYRMRNISAVFAFDLHRRS